MRQLALRHQRHIGERLEGKGDSRGSSRFPKSTPALSLLCPPQTHLAVAPDQRGNQLLEHQARVPLPQPDAVRDKVKQAAAESRFHADAQVGGCEEGLQAGVGRNGQSWVREVGEETHRSLPCPEAAAAAAAAATTTTTTNNCTSKACHQRHHRAGTQSSAACRRTSTRCQHPAPPACLVELHNVRVARQPHVVQNLVLHILVNLRRKARAALSLLLLLNQAGAGPGSVLPSNCGRAGTCKAAPQRSWRAVAAWSAACRLSAALPPDCRGADQCSTGSSTGLEETH